MSDFKVITFKKEVLIFEFYDIVFEFFFFGFFQLGLGMSEISYLVVFRWGIRGSIESRSWQLIGY